VTFDITFFWQLINFFILISLFGLGGYIIFKVIKILNKLDKDFDQNKENSQREN
jgi:hypothetical protein